MAGTSDPNLDDIPEDIDNEGPVEGENANPHSVGNTGPGIVIRNNLRFFMTNVDPDAAFAYEVLEYTNIVPAHLLDDEFGDEELFVSVLIADMQARFKYKVSYRKAWWAKKMAMRELYGDWDVSYNELQGWIAGMQEYVLGTVTDLQTLPYKDSDGKIQLGK
ncbi:hypothetical protein PVK06_005369 [Gossypium arboreum]|uniref:Uncharacterized protein n=1 Tax=Gossypium arboreum TaxID=29729 RepID=A0ABR0QVE8_GOSAR|nr:hypothetical protein PVK06_005369 [Gossypium arboreum]